MTLKSIDTPTTRCGRTGARLLAFVLVIAGALSAATTDQPSAATADNPAATTAAKDRAAIAAMDSRLRGNDGYDGMMTEGIAAFANGNFADFRRAQQTRILQHLDSALATKAEDAITDNFAFVRKADLDFQSGIGGRKGNLGFNLIGSFADGADYAFGWQLRAYGGEDIDGGANAGVFYRRVVGGVLLGINTFADYERHDYGEFVRYSVGTEMANRIASFNANWYSPDGGGRNIGGTLAVFSREGYDAQLRVNAPRYNRLKAAVDYYNYNRAADVPRDNGFRFGVQWQPTPALRLHLFYDEGADKVGGDVGYAWTIGESAGYQSGDAATFNPDLFAAASREYSQRIATVATGPAISLDISIVGIVTTAMTTAGRTIRITTTTGGMITTTTRTTMAAMTTTTTTTMTITPQVIMSMTTTTPGMTTTMTMTNTRLASVRATTRHLFTAQAGVRNYLVETQTPWPVTLPAPGTARPWVVNVSGPTNPASFLDGLGGLTVFAIESNATNPSQNETHCCGLLINSRTYSFTIVEGSEMLVPTTTVTTTTTIMGTEMRTTTTTDAVLDISVEMMTTGAVITETTMTIGGMTTFTTMTIAPITTTTRLTTYATTTITPGTNAAMGEPSSFSVDSAGISKPKRRFPRLRRENDDNGGGKGNNITNPPPIIAATNPTPSFPPIFSSFPPNSPSFLRRQESIAAKRRITKAPKGRHVVA